LNKLIREIQKQFLGEAINSPLLFSDLASMEMYIAESYQERSLIELLQNADDASAQKFIIKQSGSVVFVANDGRYFTEDDVLAICRSGSSTKQRGFKSIGYRGIGFKSVVNLADRVHIISNNLKMTFSRELTSQLMQNNVQVPLIRIPHNYTPIDNHDLIISDLLLNNFNTIFIFEKTNIDSLVQEIKNFDSSSLLFLRNIKHVEFNTYTTKIISVDRIAEDNKEVLTIYEDENCEHWLVYRPKNANDRFESLAFLLDEKYVIVPLPPQRAVVHSFMPTKDYVGLPLKINGNFSTDPSRTKVSYDELTIEAIGNCDDLIISLLRDYLVDNNDKKLFGVFNLLCENEDSLINKYMNSTRFKDYLVSDLKGKLCKNQWFSTKSGVEITLKELSVNPNWLNRWDFLRFSKKLNLIPLDKSYESHYPGILRFAERYGSEEFTIFNALHASKTIIPSVKGGVEILLACLKKYRFNFDNKINDMIKNANLIKFESGFSPLIDYKNDKIDDSYIELLKQQINDFNDLKWFLKRLDVHLNIEEHNQCNDKIEEVKTKNVSLLSSELNKLSKIDIEPKMAKFSSSIKRWRSVETNLASFLELENSINKVIDVSKSNLGYDLEVHNHDNTIDYIEVKSIEHFGVPFSLTNNEYATANEYQEHYKLAIVMQNHEGLEVCFISNPIETLNFVKRVTRWEWLCDVYAGIMKNYTFN